MPSRRRHKLSFLPKAIFFAIVFHAGLIFWSTTTTMNVPGGDGFGRKVLNTLGLSEVTLSLHPPPRSVTSDVAISIRQQSANDAPAPGAFSPQAIVPAAGQTSTKPPEIPIDLPPSSFGGSPLTVQVLPVVPRAPVAPIVAPSAPDLMAANPPVITPPPINVPEPRPEAEPAQPIAQRPQPSPIMPSAVALQPQAIANIAPPAIALSPTPASLVSPPRELSVPPAVEALPAAGIALPPMQTSLNLPELPPVELPDRRIEATPEATGIPRTIIPESPRLETSVTSAAATANRPPAELMAPAPAKINAESSLATPPPAISAPPPVSTNSRPPTLSNLAPDSLRLGTSEIQIAPPPVQSPPTPPAPENIAATPNAFPSAARIDAPLVNATASAGAAGTQIGLRPPPAASLASPDLSQQSALVARPRIAPARIEMPITPPNLSTPDLAVAPPKIGGPQVLSQRSPELRQPLIEKLGGTAASETAVDRSLAWLAKNQEADGRWTYIDENGRHPTRSTVRAHDMALTGLSVLAFLAADHSPAKDGPYRQNVARGLEWMLLQQGADGDFRGPKSLRGAGSASGNFYDHAIVTMAVAEAAIMTGDEKLKAAALSAASFICNSQNLRSGGWRYLPAESGDTSVFGWQIMALHDCEQLGFVVTPQTRDRAIHYLTLVSSGTTRTLAGYLPGESPTPVMSAEALLCRVLLGQPIEAAGVREVTDFLTRDLPQTGKPDLYYWYYASLSLAQMQANPQVRAAWDRWNTRCRDTLIATQGHEGLIAGSWQDSRWSQYGGFSQRRWGR